MQQEVVLAMLAKEPSHGYQLRARLTMTLSVPLGDEINAGQIYVTLGRLREEPNGLDWHRDDRICFLSCSDRKVYTHGRR